MCNLSGYNGNKKASINTIKLLAVYGNTRGTDGFGIWLGSKLYKFGGYNNEGNSFNILHGKIITLDKNSDSGNTIVIHNRAKSVGFVNKDNAHPYEYDYIEDKHYVFAHNGTIKNIEELCSKYYIKHEIGFTDSYYLGRIIYEHGFNVLTEYEGFAAISCLDVNTDTLYLWKGFSQCESSTPTVERPLHIYYGKNYIYYNSEDIGLVTALNTEKNIYEFSDNTLVGFKDGVAVSTTEYDRSHIKYVAPTYYNQTNHIGGGNQHVNAYTNNIKATTVEHYKIEACPQNRSGNNIYCWQGKYWKNGHILDGIYSVHTNGYLYKSSPREIEGFEENAAHLDYTIKYFHKGYMMKNAATYEEFNEKNYDISKLSSFEFASKLHADTIYLYKHALGYNMYYNNNYTNNKEVTPLFSCFTYKVNHNHVSVIDNTKDDLTYDESESGYDRALTLFQGSAF